MSILLLFFFVHIQAAEIECQISVGNKVFGNGDLKKLTEQQKNDLVEMGNPSCCLRLVGINNSVLTPLNIDKLKGMPKSIKKGMIIQRCSYDKIVDDTRIDCCAKATTCCAVAAPFVEGLAWISAGCNISSGALWGLVFVWAGAVATPCAVCTVYSCCEVCCGKNVREEIVFE